ncbi:hypothetical protein L208DRAFT_1365636 [Tricholoma matsutake]|nr:hypothetical protein L208DRAFT_1365636 [Tricholoma matsutake 945]
MDLVSPLIKQRLDVLTQAAILLRIDDLSFSSYSASINRLSDEALSTKLSLNRLLGAEDELECHLASIRHEQLLAEKWKTTMEREEEIGESITTLERRRQVLLKKAKEYHKELDALLANMPDAPPVTVTQLMKQQESNKLKEQQLQAKRAKIKAFQGLPPNLHLARQELRSARDEHMKLIQLRERLLRRMAESVM